jgi:hypothetical protein
MGAGPNPHRAVAGTLGMDGSETENFRPVAENLDGAGMVWCRQQDMKMKVGPSEQQRAIR